MRIWLCARDGNTRNDTARPVSAPTATSSTRSIAASSGLPLFIAGSSSTMIAVTVATLRLGLIAAMNASGATAITITASRAPSPWCGISTAIAPP